jgi:hypothetical protein
MNDVVTPLLPTINHFANRYSMFAPYPVQNHPRTARIALPQSDRTCPKLALFAPNLPHSVLSIANS